ncbi:hypothetical protein AX17_004596 [Amanita inopinata Kibby_2008]|nr:hypothetical protein AX17_004596 [Amanita inopinata Kibby_2008]
MLAHARISFERKGEGVDEGDSLQKRIRKVAHKAFWDEAVESLSSPQPSTQLPRLGLLYADLKDALSPLFSSDDPTIRTLSSPLAPTTSSLHSTICFLKDLLLVLKRHCAPVRDNMIDELLVQLDRCPSPSLIMNADDIRKRNRALAKVVIDVIQSVVEISEIMKTDLNKFVLGAMSEEQLRGVAFQHAKIRERELVLSLWSGPDKPAQQVVRERWRSWVEKLDGFMQIDADHQENKWRFRLLQALQTPTPVSCSVPTPMASAHALDAQDTQNAHELSAKQGNVLPPQFLFTTPSLISIQNYMQALVIVAALQSLLRIPTLSSASAPSLKSTNPSMRIVSNFVHRVWQLLVSEIEKDYPTVRSPADIDDTKIMHLADELVHTRRMLSSDVTTDEEARLRTATEKVLQPQDPVFLLLLKRLVHVMAERLISSCTPMPQTGSPISRGNKYRVPEKLKTGRDNLGDKIGKRPRLVLQSATVDNDLGSFHTGAGWAEATVVTPKGFEDPVLAREVDRLCSRFTNCITWIEEVWGDLV